MKRLLAAMGSALAAAAVTIAMGAAPAHADAVPFKDPSVIGKLTLCNTLGKPLTSGSIYTLPFVWKAVASSPAPKGYGAKGSTAALYAYQPIQNVDPQYWFFDQLTASAIYTNSAHPTAKATAADESLASYLRLYPTKWDGLVQLRLYMDAQPYGLSNTYDAAVIRVTGSRWTLLDGDTNGCGQGDATSAEWIAGAKIRALGTPAPDATAIVTPSDYAKRLAREERSGSPASSASPGGTPTAATPTPTATSSLVAANTGSSGLSGGSIAGIVIAAIVVLGGGAGYVFARQRRIATSASDGRKSWRR